MPGRDFSRARIDLRRLRRARELARRHPRVVAVALATLPAILAGFHLAVLALFLNPHLPVAASSLASGTWRGALLLAPFAIVAHAVVARRSRVRVARLLPWSLTVVLFAAALGDWVHASRFSFYLAPALGANLIKLALWLSLGAVAAFYTALLHTVHRRRYGGRSVALLLGIAAASLFVGVDRRTSFRPSPPIPAPAVRVPQDTSHLVVVTIDGASLDVFLPLARQGRLPFFSTLFERGASARLASILPVEPLAARTSLATGKLPYRHGLTSAAPIGSFWLPRGPLRLAPAGFAALGLARQDPGRSFTVGDRLARALWEVAAAAGARVALVGQPSAAAAPGGLVAFVADERFRGASGAVAFPAELEGRAALLAYAGRDETPPAWEGSPPELAEVARASLAQDRWRAAVAEALIAAPRGCDQIYVDLPGLLPLALRTRGGFEAAELEGDRGRAERAVAETLVGYAAELDSILSRLWEQLPAPRRLVVVSAFGVDRKRGVARLVSEIGRRGRFEGSLHGEPDGAFWLLGSEVARPGAFASGRIVDVMPTLLYLSGLPLARDLDGRVLTELVEPALLQKQPLVFLPSYGVPEGGDPSDTAPPER